MKHELFLKLPASQKALLITNLAIEVARRSDRINGYILYQLDSFYIEARTDLWFDVVVDVTSFDQGHRLKKYLALIDISGIIK